MKHSIKGYLLLVFLAIPSWSQADKLVEANAQVDLVESDGKVIQKLEAGTIMRLLGEDGGKLWVKLNNKVSGFIVGSGKVKRLTTAEGKAAGLYSWPSRSSTDLYTLPTGPTLRPSKVNSVYSELPPKILDSLKDFEQQDPTSAKELIEYMRGQGIEVGEQKQEQEQEPED